ncbi:hypothetical protein MBLNU457_3642t1 [Dothideomycetes sp. NU457]
MEAQHIFRLATIEAENRSLVAENQAKEKIIEYLLAQLVRASSSQASSIATGHAPTKAGSPNACLDVNSIEEGLCIDTQRQPPQPGPGCRSKPLSPPPRTSDHGTLDDYWNALKPPSSSDANDPRPIANPADGDLLDCTRPLVSHPALAPHPGHPAMQAFAKPQVDHGRDAGFIPAQHLSETSVTSSSSVLRKSPVHSLSRPEMRAEASAFVSTGFTLQSMHSVQRPRFEHVKSNVACDAAEDREETQSMLMYQPAQHDTDTKRTVLITGFPLTGKLSDLLNKIHTGLIYSITMNDTSAISGHATVLLVFFRGETARTLVAESTGKRMTVPDIHGVDHSLIVRMLDSATYPIPGWLYRRITEQGATRVVRMSGLPAELTCQAFTAFVCERGTRRHGLASVCKNDNGDFVAEFTSVVNALKAVDRLLSYPDFRNAIWSHLPDPCDVGDSATGGADETDSEDSGSKTPELIHGLEMLGSKHAEKGGRLLDAEAAAEDKDGQNEDLILGA